MTADDDLSEIIARSEPLQDLLERRRRDGESLEDVLERLREENGEIYKGFGVWADSNIEQNVKEVRQEMQADFEERIDEMFGQ